VAEETLSPQLPDLRGGLLSPRYHRYCTHVAGDFKIVFFKLGNVMEMESCDIQELKVIYLNLNFSAFKYSK